MTQPSFLHVASAPAQIPLHAKAGQFQAGAGRAHPQARQLLASLVAACVALGTTAPSVALAGPAEEAQAQALSAQGVEAYKKGDFVTAVGLFEQALQLSPGNPFYLRYAGRAWLAGHAGPPEQRIPLQDRPGLGVRSAGVRETGVAPHGHPGAGGHRHRLAGGARHP